MIPSVIALGSSVSREVADRAHGETVLAAELERARRQVPLRDELTLLAEYLEFHRTRLRDRLIVRMDVATDTMDAQVPVLLLPPLVGHAIWHSVTRTSGPGIVQVSTARHGDELHVGVHVIIPFCSGAAA